MAISMTHGPDVILKEQIKGSRRGNLDHCDLANQFA